MTKRVNDHEDRITTLEASHDELRANNDKDHQEMVLNIHDNQVQVLRDSEQIQKIWEELNKFRDVALKWEHTSLHGEALKQIATNTANIGMLST